MQALDVCVKMKSYREKKMRYKLMFYGEKKQKQNFRVQRTILIYIFHIELILLFQVLLFVHVLGVFFKSSAVF